MRRFSALLPFLPAAICFAEEPLEDYKPTLLTATDARTFTFSVPAPRGLITDREGAVLADSEVVHYVGVTLPFDGSNAHKVALEAAEIVRSSLGISAPVPTADDVAAHLESRRWFPLRLSSEPLRGDSAITLPEGSNLVLEPAYLRRYPQGSTAGHIIGYVGREAPLPTGEVVEKELLFEEFVGRAGLEKRFDSVLRGTPGLVNYIYDDTGTRVEKNVLRAPVPGLTVVTTLSLPIQKAAEASLSSKVKRGSIVIADALLGDLYALATEPRFDPNSFVPAISSKKFRSLEDDPDAPLFNRAISAAYPPGSVFKPIVACGLLSGGVVTRSTFYNGTPSFYVAGRTFKNWNKKDEGMLDVVGALKRSTNTWFYQAALNTGAAPILRAAHIFGYGERIDLDLGGETTGNLPPGRYLAPHALANTSIGQGEVLASPLQVTMGTAAIANRTRLPRPGIVLQLQDQQQRIVRTFERGPVRLIPFSELTLDAVRAGMDAVVNDKRGTAQAAKTSSVRIAGKTGTAQWTPKAGKPRWLGWFTGFTYSENPQLAFTAVYESDPGVNVSSGKVAAPMVSSIIEKIFAAPSEFGFPDPVLFEPPVYASATVPANSRPASTYSSPPPSQAPPEPQNRNLFDRLFGR